MTEETESLIVEILRRLQADVADVRGELRQVNVQIAAMGQQVGALTTAVYSGHTRMDDFERRLELRDVEPARP